MTADSATPAGAGRAVAGESRRRISYANGIPSENAGQLLVNSSKRDYNMVVLLHIPKSERRKSYQLSRRSDRHGKGLQ